MRTKDCTKLSFIRSSAECAVFSPAKIAQARLKKVTIDTQKKEEAL
ncbi:hypothetical protein S40293_09576 [Stachybotrys chartarum IBT 40293]|nr:hypothetical protein S40293_09576 [Stachybotrys chartarum IBT 40293]